MCLSVFLFHSTYLPTYFPTKHIHYGIKLYPKRVFSSLMTFKFKFLFIQKYNFNTIYDSKLLIKFAANPSIRTWILLHYKAWAAIWNSHQTIRALVNWWYFPKMFCYCPKAWLYVSKLIYGFFFLAQHVCPSSSPISRRVLQDFLWYITNKTLVRCA